MYGFWLHNDLLLLPFKLHPYLSQLFTIITNPISLTKVISPPPYAPSTPPHQRITHFLSLVFTKSACSRIWNLHQWSPTPPPHSKPPLPPDILPPHLPLPQHSNKQTNRQPLGSSNSASNINHASHSLTLPIPTHKYALTAIPSTHLVTTSSNACDYAKLWLITQLTTALHYPWTTTLYGRLPPPIINCWCRTTPVPTNRPTRMAFQSFFQPRPGLSTSGQPHKPLHQHWHTGFYIIISCPPPYPLFTPTCNMLPKS